MRGKRSPLRVLVALLATLACVAVLSACGDEGGSGGSGTGTSAGASGPVGDGITRPTELPVFEPSDETGAVPDLPKRIAFAMDNDREFGQSVRDGLEAAADARGLDFVSANANGDSARNVQQIQQFLTQGVGGIFLMPIDPAAQGPLMKQAIDRGVAVMTGLMPPSTLQFNTDQYRTGELIGEAAARYIRDELGGRANVVILNQDSIEPVRPRFRAMRDALATVPGARVVADVEPAQTQKESAFQTMNSVLQKNPQVDVVLGADSVVLGALAALRAAGKDDPRQFLGGIDGEREALDEIRRGGPYKATVALAPSIFAYSAGLSAADWLEGKAIPQAVDIKAVLLDSTATIDAFEADAEDPAAAYEDQARRDRYLEPRGSISYDTRGDYLNYVWTP